MARLHRARWRAHEVRAVFEARLREPSQLLVAAALRPHRARWAELLKRVIEIDILTCSWVAARSASSTALLTDAAVVRRNLAHLGLSSTAPTLAPARSPPEFEFEFAR